MANTKVTVILAYPKFEQANAAHGLRSFTDGMNLERRQESLNRLGFNVVTAEIDKSQTLTGQAAIKALLKKHPKAIICPMTAPIAAQAALLGCRIGFINPSHDKFILLNDEQAATDSTVAK